MTGTAIRIDSSKWKKDAKRRSARATTDIKPFAEKLRAAFGQRPASWCVMTLRKPYLVGIVGGSASGKTSFLRDLLARLPAGKCAVVSQDNYYRTIDEQERDPEGNPNFDLP